MIKRVSLFNLLFQIRPENQSAPLPYSAVRPHLHPGFFSNGGLTMVGRHTAGCRLAPMYTALTRTVFLLSVQVQPPYAAGDMDLDPALGLLLSGSSITDEQLVGASTVQIKDWAAYLPAAVMDSLRHRRRQIKNRYYQAMCRRRRKQQHQAVVRSLQQSRHIHQRERDPCSSANVDT